jgi:uncharacterized protein YqeY
MRDAIAAALKDALRNKNETRLGTLRLISAAIKDRDIEARAENNDGGVSDPAILDLLSKMIKQRQESIRLYEEGGRLDLADRERAEMDVIREFMPQQMSEDEIEAAVAATVTALGASSIRDMGRVMGALKANFAGRMDFTLAGARVRVALNA